MRQDREVHLYCGRCPRVYSFKAVIDDQLEDEGFIYSGNIRCSRALSICINLWITRD